MNVQDVEQLVRQVSAFTMANSDERDSWQKAIAMSGLLAWGDVDALTVVHRWLDRAIATQTSAGNLSYGDPFRAAQSGIDFTPTGSLSSSMGMPLLAAYDLNKSAAYLDAARRQLEALIQSPRTSDGGICPRYEARELWVDFTYLTCPFLVRFGQITGEQAYIDEAVHQFEVHTAHLLDEKADLARHIWCEVPNSYPQSTFWSRGCGWMLLAGIELLALLPTHPRADLFKDVVRRMIAAISKHQDRSGYLRNTLDDPNSKFESSGTLMYAYAIPRALELGMDLVEASRIEAALRAFEVVAGSIQPSGKVPAVTVPPGGPNAVFDWAMYGQGFFLLAAKALQPYLKN